MYSTRRGRFAYVRNAIEEAYRRKSEARGNRQRTNEKNRAHDSTNQEDGCHRKVKHDVDFQT